MTSAECTAYRPHADQIVRSGLDRSARARHYSTESKRFDCVALLFADADLHRRNEPKKRFGTALTSGRNVGHRTGDVSLAPRLIAEGSHV